jgi:uncharacterized protein
MTTNLNRRKFLKLGICGGMGALACGYGVYGALQIEVNTYKIPVPHLPMSFNDFTFVQLTDIHYGFGIPLSVVERVIHQVNLIKRDAIVCTGDYIHGGGSARETDTLWSRLKTLKAKNGVYSVLGNHDHMFSNGYHSLSCLEKSGQSVRHGAVPIVRGDDRVWIGGAGDMWHDDLGIDEAFKNTPSDECKILLSHHPGAADTEFETRVDLMISGHTHGGQIIIPPFGSTMSGLQEKSGVSVYISKGIGWYFVPIRINCAPEISVLKLVRSPSV